MYERFLDLVEKSGFQMDPDCYLWMRAIFASRNEAEGFISICRYYQLRVTLGCLLTPEPRYCVYLDA